jgi:hypothetical protein
MGRVGSLGAPAIGGALLGLHLPLRELYLAPSAALLVGAAAAVLLAVFCSRRFRGFRLADKAAGLPPVPGGTDATRSGYDSSHQSL